MAAAQGRFAEEWAEPVELEVGLEEATMDTGSETLHSRAVGQLTSPKGCEL